MDERKLREELASKLMDLGQMAHQGVRNEKIKDEAIGELSSEICLLEKKLNIAEGNHIPSRDERKCPSCMNEYEEDAVFCGNCGQNIKEFYEAEVETCSVCESTMKKGSNYCGICGSKQIQ